MQPSGGASDFPAFEEWINARELITYGTNAGALELPFQGWRRFKEAFAPEIVHRAVSETPGSVSRLIDPFGGSGTSALASQFLGIHPSTIEVNPFLADLIEAKIAVYDLRLLSDAFAQVVEEGTTGHCEPEPFFNEAPKTFLEPGVDGNYLFSRAVAQRLCAYRQAIERINDDTCRRFLRVQLAATAVPVSNAVVSGKGRRYRRKWKEREVAPDMVDELFEKGVLNALFDLRRYDHRPCRDYTLLRGDSRQLIAALCPADVAVYFPPFAPCQNCQRWGGCGSPVDRCPSPVRL